LLGARAEAAVADYVELHGFSVLTTNLRLGPLELDLVARKGGLVVIVEVRARGRGAYESALASVSVTKRRHLLRATERLWRARLVHDRSVERVRIDVAAVTFDDGVATVEYIPGAVVASP
jgi:putative endonuclease